MRAIVEVADNISSVVRYLIAAIVIGGFLIGLLMTAGVSYVAPKVAEDYGERAERISQQAIAAAQEEVRNRELAEDGWGYDESEQLDRGSMNSNGDSVGGWSDDSN